LLDDEGRDEIGAMVTVVGGMPNQAQESERKYFLQTCQALDRLEAQSFFQYQWWFGRWRQDDFPAFTDASI
jgi:hypothetical protein